jgi:hypothetical protein
VQNSRNVGIFVVGPALMTCQDFRILAYQWIGSQDFFPESLEVASCNKE